MARRSSIKGVNKLRRTLNRIEPESKLLVRTALQDVAQTVEAYAIQGAPRREGDLVRSIGTIKSSDGLSFTVGPGIKAWRYMSGKGGVWNTSGYAKGKPIKMSEKMEHDRWQFFKAYWYEYGTKGSKDGNVPAQPARPFMGPAWNKSAAWAKTQMRRAIDEALRRAAR